VVTPFASEIQQSWYRCTWADPLPAGEADGPCGDISNP
jgi:hypothetical protein